MEDIICRIIIFLYYCVFVVTQISETKEINNKYGTESGLTNNTFPIFVNETPNLPYNISYKLKPTAEIIQCRKSKKRKKNPLKRVKTTDKIETLIVKLGSAVTVDELLKTYPTRKLQLDKTSRTRRPR